MSGEKIDTQNVLDAFMNQIDTVLQGALNQLDERVAMMDRTRVLMSEQFARFMEEVRGMLSASLPDVAAIKLKVEQIHNIQAELMTDLIRFPAREMTCPSCGLVTKHEPLRENYGPLPSERTG